jgi:hypothetical protein
MARLVIQDPLALGLQMALSQAATFSLFACLMMQSQEKP